MCFLCLINQTTFPVNTLLKLEEFAMFLFSTYLFTWTDFQWWWYPALLLAPDIGMLGYLAGAKVGAWMYNLFHHKGIAVVVLMAGWYFSDPYVTLAGIILFGHSSMDRMFGYGLKEERGFEYTHLGRIGS